MGVPLVLAEPTGRYQRSLRRFRFGVAAGHGPDCPAGGICDATTVLGVVEADDPLIKWYTGPNAEHVRGPTSGDNWPHDDERWPKTCPKCGGAFTDADQWQRNDSAIYRRTDGPE